MSSTTPRPAPKRFQQIVKLRPEHYEAYKACHAKVWPEVLEQIRQCHMEDCRCPSTHNPAVQSHIELPLRFPTIEYLPEWIAVLRTDSISYDDASHLLFASFKWTGEDFEADMKAMRENEKVREWWRMTDGYQESVAEGAVSSEDGGVDGVPGWWKPLEEVFYFAG